MNRNLDPANPLRKRPPEGFSRRLLAFCCSMPLRMAYYSLVLINPPRWREHYRKMGMKDAVIVFFMQRVLRINSHVPWPVHWSSIVIGPERIVQASLLPRPGLAPGQYIQAGNGIRIGRNVRLGPGVKLVSSNHNLCNYDEHEPAPPIVIGDDCWLGADAVVLQGVSLGNHVVVGAGAVVTKSFPDDCLIGGVPAKIIKRLPPYGGRPRPNGAFVAGESGVQNSYP